MNAEDTCLNLVGFAELYREIAEGIENERAREEAIESLVGVACAILYGLLGREPTEDELNLVIPVPVRVVA